MSTPIHICKFCKTPLKERFIDILFPNGVSISKEKSSSLPTYVCSHCFLVQIGDQTLVSTQEKVYVSSFSYSWLTDMDQYLNRIFKRFEMTNHNLIVELTGSQDALTCQRLFPFGNSGLLALIDMHGKADMLICQDALTYVPDINDFVSAIKLFLKPGGIATLEFLHLLPLMERDQFEVPFTGTVSYFSFTTIDMILKHHGLTIFDIEECLPKGCIRIYAKHFENQSKRNTDKAQLLRGRERDKGMSSMSYYMSFKNTVTKTVA